MNYNLKHKYEYWKPIKTYKNGTLIDYSDTYFVSNLGKIKNIKRNIIMNQFENNGYMMVTLRKDCTKHNFKVHRLVAEQFLPNPDNLPCINHKDRNRKNNVVYLNPDETVNVNLSNLEWCSYKYNNDYRKVLYNGKFVYYNKIA